MIRYEVILFGAGKIAEKYIKILTDLGVTILFLADNNQQRWDENFCGIIIKPPAELYKSNAQIVIANSYRNVIRHQLEQMDLHRRISPFIEIVCHNCQYHITACTAELKKKMCKDELRTIVLDNLYGKWGGAESWTHIVGEELKSRRYPVMIIGNNEADRQFEKSELVYHFDIENLEPVEILWQIVKRLYEQLPITLIDISSDYVLWAACILKNYCPDKVKIITAVLNDMASAHEKQLEGQIYIDAYFCISTKLRDKFCNQYGVLSNRVFYKDPFADYDENFRKNYNLEEHMPLRIGYACRLCKAQKRTDMLPFLIEKLENRHINYQMNIAGDGECQIEIKEYIEKHHLTSKIRMHGFLKKAEMPDYWKQQDVYLNFSEYEGTSLTMLDAMSYGTVPVVTEVSGVNDFIDHKINGLVYPVGDIDGIADGILYLEKNRVLLWEYGNICRQRIHEKCSLKDYIDYIEELLNI